MRQEIFQVDAFTTKRFTENPAGVVSCLRVLGRASCYGDGGTLVWGYAPEMIPARDPLHLLAPCFP